MIRLVALVTMMFVGTALAQQRPQPAAPATPSGPQEIGRFDDWIAYTTEEGGQKVCYVGTKAQSSAPELAGRGEVVLSVAHRPGSRGQVSMLAGYAYPSGAAVTVTVDGATALAFYTGGRAAFAHNGAAAINAFRRGNEAVAKGPQQRGGKPVSDSFSLKGFTAALEAIGKACPGR